MGSPAFAVLTLDALHASGYEVAAVVTQPDRPAGRGGRVAAPAVKAAALALGLPVLQPETLKAEAVREQLRELRADVFVVAAYGKILGRGVLAIPGRGCLNVHASLLPRWRGASPIVAAILAGDEETGVCVMEMEPGLDTGPVVACERTPIGPSETAGELEPRLAQLGAETLVQALPAWLAGDLAATPQDDSRATACSLVTKSDGYLRRDMSAVAAERAVRAYNPWPGASIGYGDGRLLIWRAEVLPGPCERPSGTLFVHNRQPGLALAGAALALVEVQRPGGKRLTGEQFLNGERGQLCPEAGLA